MQKVSKALCEFKRRLHPQIKPLRRAAKSVPRTSKTRPMIPNEDEWGALNVVPEIVWNTEIGLEESRATKIRLDESLPAILSPGNVVGFLSGGPIEVETCHVPRYCPSSHSRDCAPTIQGIETSTEIERRLLN